MQLMLVVLVNNDLFTALLVQNMFLAHMKVELLTKIHVHSTNKTPKIDPSTLSNQVDVYNHNEKNIAFNMGLTSALTATRVSL